MKTLILTLIIVGLLVSCSDKIYQSIWQSQPIVANGEAGEWELPLRFYDKTSTLQYSLTNDSSNLYLCLRAIDGGLQFRIRNSGLQIWFDTTGNLEQNLGFIYPFIDKNNQLMNFNLGMEPGQEVNASYLEKKKMKLIGINSVADQQIEFPNEFGILASMNIDEFGVLVYECAIPLNLITKSNLEKPLGITFFMEGLTLPENNYRMAERHLSDEDNDFRMGSGQPPMPGQQMVGGMPGGMPPGSMNGGFQSRNMQDNHGFAEKDSFKKPIEIKFKVQLVGFN